MPYLHELVQKNSNGHEPFGCPALDKSCPLDLLAMMGFLLSMLIAVCEPHGIFCS